MITWGRDVEDYEVAEYFPVLPHEQTVRWNWNKIIWFAIALIASASIWATVAVFAWHGSRTPEKPSPVVEDPSGAFQKQSYSWVELTGEFASQPFPCPTDRTCI